LGVVIGRSASGVAVDDALDFVAGYVVANDVSARDLQFADGQWVRGKSLDTFRRWASSSRRKRCPTSGRSRFGLS
jgi:2-keto-4-pentenoate hydratase/2-oxohepta-3-ene-1,7-dioic acid hydratase in catechol pathway